MVGRQAVTAGKWDLVLGHRCMKAMVWFQMVGSRLRVADKC